MIDASLPLVIVWRRTGAIPGRDLTKPYYTVTGALHLGQKFITDFAPCDGL